MPGGDPGFEVHPGSTDAVLAIHGVGSRRRLGNWLGPDKAATIMTSRGAAVAATLLWEAQA